MTNLSFDFIRNACIRRRIFCILLDQQQQMTVNIAHQTPKIYLDFVKIHIHFTKRSRQKCLNICISRNLTIQYIHLYLYLTRSFDYIYIHNTCSLAYCLNLTQFIHLQCYFFTQFFFVHER